MEVYEHETIQALMQALGVPDDLPKIVLVNGQHTAANSLLTDGDIVSVFPPLIGGRSSQALLNAVRGHVSWPNGVGEAIHGPFCQSTVMVPRRRTP